MASERQGHRSISSCILLVAAVLLLSAPRSSASCYKRIFAFGDSIIDTGNFVYSTGSAPNALKEFPYGMTFFHHPTGRVCDGRVLLDFYAQALGLPLVQPSLPEQRWGQCTFGANFAVFAATALPPEYFQRRGLSIPGSANLGMQMGWFKEVVQRIAPGPGARRLLGESLIILGEIGGNDYNFWLLNNNKTRETAYQFIPDVVNRIISIAQELIDLGAKTIMIPGNFPIGCVPKYLNDHQTGNRADYDQFGCLRWYNDFSMRHNTALFNEVNRLRARHPWVKLIYADYFGAAMEIFKNPHRFGIGDPLVACCGGGGRYHVGTCDKHSAIMGSPANCANWDGIHMTEKAYNVIADGVLHGPYANPPLLHSC
ncbi:GDSL esterase/lipase At1g28600-like [Triticum dicoccoides]|uniref:GDSL esterase/lipase At1g28600-like n=1 Tax=Triticum dicoccoides TaxID=85692 RepID=UPI00188F1120|nr:GDSL esterase/lipase At1g28600-like [Triticum dicoccoides]